MKTLIITAMALIFDFVLVIAYSLLAFMSEILERKKTQ